MKKLILLSMFGLFAIILAGFASAQCTINTTAIMRGTVFFNVSCDAYNYTNCSVTGTSALTGDSVTFMVWNTTPNVGNILYNASVVTNGRRDASDWSFTGTCYNTSLGTKAITTSTSNVIDNTRPVALSSLLPATGSYYTDPNQKYDIAFSAASVNSTKATLYMDSYPVAMSVTTAGVISYTESFLDDQVHNWYIVASDGLNTTTSTPYTLEINTPGGGASTTAKKQQAALAAQSQSIFTNTDGSISMNGILILGAATVFLFTYKKKGKR